MDIIPEPRDAVPGICIPLAEPIELPDPEADLNVGLAPLTSPDAPFRNATEVAAYLQSWLFFGLLARTLGGRFSLEDFVTHVEGRPECRFLSLRNLDALLHEVYDTRTDHEVDADADHDANDDNGIDADRDTDTDSDTDTNHSTDQHSLDLQHAADIVRQLEALGHLRESPAGETGLLVLVLVRRLDGFSRATNFVWSSLFLQRRMRDDGWCPQEIDWIMSHYDPVVACFLARLRRTRSVIHTQCTETACVANNVRLDSGYRQRHVSDGCKCSAISVDADAVKAIIAQGRIPLVSVQHQERGQISLKVTAASSSSSYTAMSHVWSDGLGNPTANALPQCQLELISTSISKDLTEKGDLGNHRTKSVHIDPVPKQDWASLGRSGKLFWLDTLCIPVSVPGDSQEAVDNIKKLKSMAINQMGEIYAAARQVLVLDSELQRAHGDAEDDVSNTELIARLVCCSWMRRCWTLQEGALASKITFLSGSGLVTPLFLPGRDIVLSSFARDIGKTDILPGPHMYWWLIKRFLSKSKEVRDDEEGEAAALRAPVLAYLRRSFQETLDDITCILPHHHGEWNDLGRFSTIWNSLAYRNTTMKEDLPAIFANLLNINAFKILQEDPFKRMQALLRSLYTLPVELLFNKGPFAEVGMDSLSRWVPSVPNKFKMGRSRELMWTKDGDLEFRHFSSGQKREEDFLAVIFGGDTPRRDRTCSAFILPLFYQEGDDSLMELSIRLEYPDKDEMSRHDDCEEILILDRRRSPGIRTAPTSSRGCLLRLLDQDDDDLWRGINVTGQFDCPLTWTVASPDDLAGYPRVPPIKAWRTFNLTIKCDAGPRKLVQRPFHGDSTILSDNFIFLAVGPLCQIFFISIVIRIVIEVRLGWSNLSPLGRAATMVFALEATGIFAYIVPPPLAQVLFIVDRFRDAGGLSSLDVAYVVLSLVGNLWLLFSWAWVAKLYARSLIYKMWLQSFSPEWPEDGGWGWRAYFAAGDMRDKWHKWLDAMDT